MNVRGPTFFFSGSFSCASSSAGTVFLDDLPLCLALADDAPAATSDTEDGGGAADAAAPTFSFSGGFSCASSSAGTVFPEPCAALRLSFSRWRTSGHFRHRGWGGAADAVAELAGALEERPFAVGSGYCLDAVFLASAALSLADFFPVLLCLDNRGGAADA